MNAEPDPPRVVVACDILEPTPPSNLFRILVIDDEPANRMVLRRLLNAVGYEVVEAANGASGLSQVLGSRPDLIIVDMEMPVLNGSETIAAVRRFPEPSLSALPIIAASGNPTQEMEDSALDEGANIWMTKPFDFSTLQKNISKLLQTRRHSSVTVRRVSKNPSTVKNITSTTERSQPVVDDQSS
jgi:CheY-like chemotaxis protein